MGVHVEVLVRRQHDEDEPGRQVNLQNIKNKKIVRRLGAVVVWSGDTFINIVLNPDPQQNDTDPLTD